MGIVFALGSITAIAWTSFAIRSVDRSQDALDDALDEIDYWAWDPDFFIDDHLDRERDFFSVVRIIGFIGLMFGVISRPLWLLDEGEDGVRGLVRGRGAGSQ